MACLARPVEFRLLLLCYLEGLTCITPREKEREKNGHGSGGDAAKTEPFCWPEQELHTTSVRFVHSTILVACSTMVDGG